MGGDLKIMNNLKRNETAPAIKTYVLDLFAGAG